MLHVAMDGSILVRLSTSGPTVHSITLSTHYQKILWHARVPILMGMGIGSLGGCSPAASLYDMCPLEVYGLG